MSDVGRSIPMPEDEYYNSYELLTEKSTGSDWLRAFTALQRRQKFLDDRIESYRHYHNRLAGYVETDLRDMHVSIKSLNDSFQETIDRLHRRLADVETALLAASDEEGETEHAEYTDENRTSRQGVEPAGTNRPFDR